VLQLSRQINLDIARRDGAKPDWLITNKNLLEQQSTFEHKNPRISKKQNATFHASQVSLSSYEYEHVSYAFPWLQKRSPDLLPSLLTAITETLFELTVKGPEIIAYVVL